ncbi:hypothetical protein HNP52_002728 [Sphingomonas kyeonggiensis]|uniref:Uncharacterized protein n=1 Tax=Sphingomonas kyeonggiensis TaxID=1268553 RepID=A0A7W7NTE1_9SPHN|nr:hypothetical protein [Sphingomonas kyeonggiensis]MBB4839659.1 hypothetical protein [Sphingomonas kyeonggiensis]
MLRELAADWTRPGMLVPTLCAVVLMAAILVAGREPARTPPPPLAFAGLPVSGNAEVARRAGFTRCVRIDAFRLRCRREPVMLFGEGPYEAAVDLIGSKGQGGFAYLTLWKNGHQEAVYKLVEALQRQGWRHCETGSGRWGDQDIYTHPGAPVRVSMDLSYYGKRRVRFLPLSSPERSCTPWH